MWNAAKFLIIFPMLALLALVIVIVQAVSYLNFGSLNMDFAFYCALALVALLVPLNIVFEALKLRLGKSEDSGLFDAIIRTCQGFYMQFLLPYGLGTVAGRSWNVEDHHKRVQLEATFLGGLMQSLSNLIGLIFLFFIPPIVTDAFVAKIPELNKLVMLAFLGLVIFVLLALYFFKNWSNWKIWRNFSSLKFMGKGKSSWSAKNLGLLFLFSYLRYLVYLMQWLIVLIWIGQLPFLHALTGVIIYLTLITLVVLPPALSVLSRSGIAWAVFGVLGMEANLALSLCWLIFLLNNGIPAILGSIFMLSDLRWVTKQ